MKQLILSIILFSGMSLMAQDQLLRNQIVSLSVGVSEHSIEKFSASDKLDFMNYTNEYDGNFDFILIKLAYSFEFSKNMSADVELIMLDDIIPDNFDMKINYSFQPWLGIGAGTMLHKNWISSFEEFHKQTMPDYHLLDENSKYFVNYDLGFYLSPFVQIIDNEFIKLDVACDLGVSAFMKYETDFVLKKKLSNEKMRYQYNTLSVYQPFIQPRLDIKIKAFELKKASLGFLFNTQYYYANRSINYSRSIQRWTAENEIAEKIEPSKHLFTKFSLNLGMFVRW